MDIPYCLGAVCNNRCRVTGAMVYCCYAEAGGIHCIDYAAIMRGERKQMAIKALGRFYVVVTDEAGNARHAVGDFTEEDHARDFAAVNVGNGKDGMKIAYVYELRTIARTPRPDVEFLDAPAAKKLK